MRASAEMAVGNPNCDGSGPCAMGEVRVLPLGSSPHHGNLILCRNCFHREIAFREERNLGLAEDCQFKLPQWESLAVYGGDSGMSIERALVVLAEVKAALGRNYKSKVNLAWMDRNYRRDGLDQWAGQLQQIRNAFGPSWLVRTRV